MTQYIDPRHKVLWHVDRVDAIKQGYKPAPVNIEVDLSNRCSLGCEWCHFAYTHTRGPLAKKVETPQERIPGGDLMDYALAKSIIVQAKEMGVRSLTWTGGGEPTLHPDFNSTIVYAYRHGIDQGLYTHGGHIDQKRAQFLRYMMKWVYVSLDECTAEQYQASKGVDGFARAIRGIVNLSEAAGDATIGVGYLLHPDNYAQIPEMIDLAFARGADYVQFRPTVRYSQDVPDTPSEDTGWLNACITELQKVQNLPGVLADVERFDYYRQWNGRSYSTCYWTQLQSVITPDGSLWTCVNKREHSGELLGNLTEMSLFDIWQQKSGPYAVNGGCRVMCRGHIANVTLDNIMTAPPHRNFI